MEVILADHAGFCFGVKRAVDYVYSLLENGEKIYTYGPIIHNEQVVNDLEKRGVSVIDSEEGLKKGLDGKLVIRAHGVPKYIYELLEKNEIEYVDGTCPFVKKIHNIVSEMSDKGYQIVIIGSSTHPEVLGIMGWSNEDTYVVENASEAQNISLDMDKPVCIVAQTTFNTNKFKELVEIIKTRGYNVNVVDTICNATKERQETAKELASKVDAMIVIGGQNSSNTQKLYNICKSSCESTYYVQTVKDVENVLPKAASLVGITAGASTPNNIIEEVQNYVRINF